MAAEKLVVFELLLLLVEGFRANIFKNGTFFAAALLVLYVLKSATTNLLQSCSLLLQLGHFPVTVAWSRWQQQHSFD